MGHVCRREDIAAFETAQRAEGLAIGASGVSMENDINWEEAIAKLAQSDAAFKGRERGAPAPQPRKHLGLTWFEWRLFVGVINWGSLLVFLGFLLGRYTR